MTEPDKAVKSQARKIALCDFDDLVQIGHGAFGKVYKAVYRKNKKIFALKKISKKQVKNLNMIAQLNNEIKISKSLDHPNIIRLYDTFEDGDDIYLVLQYAQNGQLYSKLCRQGKFDEKNVKKMIIQLIEAIKELHSKSPPIIHRDIKPENILLDKSNKIKLADFGWSNFLNKPRKTYCGTIDYLAPEMIDKSGHDEKLDIWCLGVLVYELLTGKTPFLINGPKSPENKKMMEKNILNVNISFPNDMSLLAKNFILGMIKRNPEERMSLKQIRNHEWLLTTNNEQKIQQLPIMHKKEKKDVPVIDTQETTIISSLNKKIQELETQVNNLKVNQKMGTLDNKNLADNAEYTQMTKEMRRLKTIEQKHQQLQKENQKYWDDLNKKDKQIIFLKNQVKNLEEGKEAVDKLKADKKILQEKFKKIEKDLYITENKNAQLREELSSANDSLALRIKRGEKLTAKEANSEEFAQYLQNQLQELNQKFQESKKALLKVLEKTKISNQKEDQLIRLRVEQKNIKDQQRAELREQFQEQKDQILLNARKQMMEERDKWSRERDQLKSLFEESNTGSVDGSSTKASSKSSDLELELKTLRELTSYYQKTINYQNLRVKDLEDELKRKK